MTEETKIQINPNAPQGLHPVTIQKKFEAELAAGEDAAVSRPAYQAAFAAFTRAYDVAGAMAEAVTKLKKAEAIGPHGKQEIPVDLATEAADAMGRAFARAAPLFDIAEREIETAQVALTRRMDGMLLDPRRNEPSRVQTSSEIRQFVNNVGKTSGQRFDWLHGRIDAGDLDAISAVLSGSCWSVGLEPEKFKLLREICEIKFCPKEHARRESLEKLRETLRNGGGSLIGTYETLVPRPNKPRAEGRDALKKLEQV